MKWRNFLTVMFFILPWLAGFGALTLYPLASAAWHSFCDYSVLTPALWTGMDNYSTMLGDAVFWRALWNSLLFSAIYLPLSIGVSLFLALLLNLRVPAKGVLRTIYFLPTIVPMVCLAVIWQWLLKGDGGLVNALVSPVLDGLNGVLGLQLRAPNWLLEPEPARIALTFASLWTTGNTVLIYLAALQGVPAHLYESAEIDGATTLQKYWHVSVPSISPVLFYTLVSGLIGCLQTFAVPYVLAGGGDGPDRALLFLSTYIFQNAFQYWNMGYACALAMVLLALVCGLTWVLMRFSAKRIHSETD